MALCLLALAFTFVPANATRPSFMAPASNAIFSTCSNSPSSVARWILRKSEMVLKFGALPAAQHPKGNVLCQSLLDVPRTEQAHAISVKQQLRHHPRIVGRLPALLVAVHRIHGGQIQIIDDIANEVDQNTLARVRLPSNA